MAIMNVKGMLCKGYTEITQNPHVKCLGRDYTSCRFIKRQRTRELRPIPINYIEYAEVSHGRMMFMWVARLRIGKGYSKDTIHLEQIESGRQNYARCGRRNVSNRSSAQRGRESLSKF